MFQPNNNGVASQTTQYQRVSTVDRDNGLFPDEVVTKKGSPRWLPILVLGLFFFSFLLSGAFGGPDEGGVDVAGRKRATRPDSVDPTTNTIEDDMNGNGNNNNNGNDDDVSSNNEEEGEVNREEVNTPPTSEEEEESTEKTEEPDPHEKVEQEEPVTAAGDPCARSLLSKRPGRPNAMGVQFLHVPKAGGTSIQQTLWRWAERQDLPATHQDYGGAEWLLPKRVSPKHIGLLQGHRGYGYAKNVPRPLFVAVVLREPVSRFISLFDYTKYHRFMPVWHHRTLEDIILSYKSTRETCPACLLPSGNATVSDKSLHQRLSIQLQFLCGYDCVVWDLQQKQNLLDGGAHLANLPLRYSNEEMLVRAKAKLRACDAVAVLSHLDDLVVQLQTHLDWVPRDFTAWPHENTEQSHRMARSKLSPETKAYLKSLMKEEVELYELAEKIAAEKTREAKLCLKKRRGGR